MKISTTPPKSTHKSATGTTQATRLDGEGLCLWKKYLQLCLEIREIEVAELLKASVRLSNELAKINRREKINALLAEDGKCSCGERAESIGEIFSPEEKRKENHDLTKLREQRNEVLGQLVAFMQLHQRGGCASLS